MNPFDIEFKIHSLIKFAIPSILMMFFLSIYTIIDGIFISNFVSTTALSATNMVYPFISIVLAIALMLGSGGSAIVGKNLGEEKKKLARRRFTMIVFIAVILGIIFAIVGNIYIDKILHIMGVTETQYELGKTYLSVLLLFSPAIFLQACFQSFTVTSGLPTKGLILTAWAGITNIVLDYVFIVPFKMGILGAAIATGLGYTVAAVLGIYIFLNKENLLHFSKFSIEPKVLLKTCSNGASEMITNAAISVTTFLFNIIFLRYYGEDGVASITIILYYQFIFSAIQFGYSAGIAPIVSYKYGEKNLPQLKRIMKLSLIFISLMSVALYGISLISAKFVFQVFADTSSNVYKISIYGLPIFAVSFLFMGIGIFASGWYTALSDGRTSGFISFSRTFLLLVISLIVLPTIFGPLGVWLAVPVAELIGLVLSCTILYKKRGIV
ncbi:MAG: MATE family efflux transporter [Lachnospirales bacterium]